MSEELTPREAVYYQGKNQVLARIMRLVVQEMYVVDAPEKALLVLIETKVKVAELCDELQVPYEDNVHPADLIERCLRVLPSTQTEANANNDDYREGRIR